MPGQPTTTAWATGLTTPADFLVGPDGSLWWLAQYNATFAPTSGSLHRIRYVGAPTAVASAEVRTLALGVSPNPSSASLELSFSLAAPERVRLDLYDLGGRRVRLLLEGAAPAGETRLRGDGRDELGGPLDAGVYFARLTREGAAPMIARVLRVR